MGSRAVRFSSFGVRWGCCLLVVASVLVSAAEGWAQSTPATWDGTAFEAATVKPVKDPDPNRMHDNIDGRHVRMFNTSLRDLIMIAYELNPRQIDGGPKWLATDEFDVDGVAPEGVAPDERMLRPLLAERFKLAFHWEQREMATYELTVAKGGPKLKIATAEDREMSGCAGLGRCSYSKRTMQEFANFLGFVVLDKIVADKTGLEGQYDFSLRWTPDESQFFAFGVHVPPPSNDPNAPPGLFDAMQEQLGLKLEPRKMQAEVLVIDHVERPSDN